MRLENHLGLIADPATPESIALAVDDLTAVGEAFVVLCAGDELYVQAAGTVGEDFLVEQRDGCAGEHYRGDRRVTAVELTALLDGYLRGAPDWRHRLTWHRVKVGVKAPLA